MASLLEDLAFTRLASRVPGLHRHNLLETLCSIKREKLQEEREWWDETFEELCSDYHFVPDASRFVEETETIQLFEIEDTHKISFEKLDKIRTFSDILFELSQFWTELYSVDRYGVIATLIWSFQEEEEGPLGSHMTRCKILEDGTRVPVMYWLGYYDGPPIGTTI